MRTFRAVYGTLAGLAIGAIAGILFAPKKGSKTRKKIRDKGDYYLRKLKFESTKKDAEQKAEKAKAKYDDVKNVVKNAASDIKQKAS